MEFWLYERLNAWKGKNIFECQTMYTVCDLLMPLKEIQRTSTENPLQGEWGVIIQFENEGG